MTATERTDFLRDIIDADLAAGRHTRVATRFPPEPNGYLHIGHAKSICLNFGLARDYQGTCNLRYDDTNPTKEDVEYVESIEHDVRWLGFAPTAVLFSADYFPRMYELAERLVNDGLAYVCDLSDEEIRQHRGTLSEPGRPSPFRDRTVADNLDLLRRMKAGEFADGARVLRAKIDMAAANMKMRDPLLYRIRHAEHHRTGDAWCIYPMYDYAHPLEDAIEGITHSICTLEFENNRELYDWVLDHTGPWTPRPRQYEFARLALDYTVMSKRKLLQLVTGGTMSGWDDPRMPTLAGLRRRGYRPEAIRAFCDVIGVAKNNSMVEVERLEGCVRDDLNQHAPRVMAVLDPLEVELLGWDELIAADPGAAVLDAPSFPPDIGKPGSRPVPMSGRVWIERGDYADEPSKDWKRLGPGRTVRLRYGWCVTCEDVVRDGAGAVTRLRCRVLPETRAGAAPADGRKVGGVIHWVDAASAVPAEVRLYDRLFAVAQPEEGGADFMTNLNPTSLSVVRTARVEASLAQAAPGSHFQFERTGYFVTDVIDSKPGALVFNKVVDLAGARPTATAGATKAAPTAPPASGTGDGERAINPKAKTRPKSKSPAEYRAEARARDAALAAAYQAAIDRHGLTAEQADLVCADAPSAALLADAVGAGAAPAEVARWMINELPRALGEAELAGSKLTGAALAAIIGQVGAGALSVAHGKEVLAEVVRTGASPGDVVRARGFDAVVDQAALLALVDQSLAAHPDKLAQLRGGKTGLVGFFVGQVVKAAGGKADPALVAKLVSQRVA